MFYPQYLVLQNPVEALLGISDNEIGKRFPDPRADSIDTCYEFAAITLADNFPTVQALADARVYTC